MPAPLTEKEQFPTTDGITPDAYSLRVISAAYATSTGELNTILQYIYQSFYFEAKGYGNFAEEIESIAIAEMIHFKALGRCILALGGSPVYTACPPSMYNFYSAKFVTYSKNLIMMAEDDIRAEKHAIRTYERMLTLLNNERVRAIIERILKDERLHLKAFENILCNLKS
ncbi:MAG: rubrerythrin [Clostridia bacterium]|nr:rubrerythrin [Clostridia bacterium]